MSAGTAARFSARDAGRRGRRLAAALLLAGSAAACGTGGGPPAAPRVTVHWPDGRAEVWPAQPVDEWRTLEQGTGEPAGGETR